MALLPREGPEAEKLRQVFSKYQADPRLGDADEIMNVRNDLSPTSI